MKTTKNTSKHFQKIIIFLLALFFTFHFSLLMPFPAMVARASIGILTFTEEQRRRADVYVAGAGVPDGNIYSNDLLIIARASLGMVAPLCSETSSPSSVCGNGILETSEQCDDGNLINETCTYGQTSCTICNATCISVVGATAYCGDGVINGSEQCDDGNTLSGDGCSSICQAAPKTVDVSYTSNGFSPSSVTTNSGDSVRWTNNSGGVIQIAEGTHPAHTDCKYCPQGSGVGATVFINAGSSFTFQFIGLGTAFMHNHLNASKTMTITVQ